MAKKAKTLAVNLPVPQCTEDATTAIADIGGLNREIGRLSADANDQIADINRALADKVLPLQERVTALTEGLKVWAEANRAALTNGGKVKTANLVTGILSWRNLPPKVGLRKVEDVIAAITRMGLGKKFLRTKQEVDKEAMLKDPEKARTVPGVTVGSAGEEFIVEPFEVDAPGVQA
ncbi:host-nuclease inhibitor Gam family protein [Ancylobacter sp. A5.8]|uniref:host-nuclease inhibitor Gam family protein n=1 Tax=Ancylobacter gelatini TaxID=2919920 RepID=UPI001F4EC30E|nr:host-nuclease inhibitor Gam family protein [Ancylobacter gelatini]MCJ8142936.1 host-nuclease inhibitor Gam family protein [Ancylobacter gelatini]